MTPLSEALALSAAEYRERYRLGPESWYVVLPSRYEQRSTEVVAAYVRMRDHGHGLPAGLVGVEFASGRRDPRPTQLRRVTFPRSSIPDGQLDPEVLT